MNEHDPHPDDGESADPHGDGSGRDDGRAEVPLGASLAPAPTPAEPADGAATPAPMLAGETRLAAGMQFIGNALLCGPCTVAGEVEGHLRTAPGAAVSIVVATTGRVRGDISARQISVFGATEGLLDAGTGDVALHDGARIHGTVRYGRIRVDGADLNATLERAAPQPS